jgi:hypothetical protein
MTSSKLREPLLGRKLAKRQVRVVLAVLFAGLLSSASAKATPVVYYPIPGSASEDISHLTVGTDGTLWVAQRISTGPANSERHMRVLHIGTDGHVIASTPEQEGDPYVTEMAPALDGGLWLHTVGPLEHVAPDGSVKTIEHSEGDSLSEGSDGRAWLLRCTFTYLPSIEEHCKAVAVALDGTVETFELPGISIKWPAGSKSGGSQSRSLPTATGVWFWKIRGFEGASPSVSAEFMTYAGTGVPVTFPGLAYLAAPAAGDSIWWLENEIEGEVATGAKIGELAPDGSITDPHHMTGVSEYHDAFVAEGGKNGDLLWAQNGTWNETLEGQLGVARLDGSNTPFMVEKGAAYLLTDPEAHFWSGSCTFGARLYEAPDGALWTISGGHPARVTRQQLSGEFETYWLHGSEGVDGMLESSPHELWFTLNTPNGPELALVDPLNPPPAEPKYPVNGAIVRTHYSTHAKIDRLLRSLLHQASKALRHRHGKAIWLRGSFPAQGSVTVKVNSRMQHKLVVVGAGKKHGARGKQLIKLVLHHRGLMLSQTSGRHQATIVISFSEDRGVTMRRTAKVHIAR